MTPLGGDYLSRVGCFPTDDRLSRFRDALNDHGLFNDIPTAIDFAATYVCLRLPEWDVPTGVFRVRLISPAPYPSEGAGVASRGF